VERAVLQRQPTSSSDDVGFLGRIAVRVELDRTTRIFGGPARFAESGEEAVTVLDMAVDRLPQNLPCAHLDLEEAAW
jgi:hypothetical protein